MQDLNLTSIDGLRQALAYLLPQMAIQISLVSCQLMGSWISDWRTQSWTSWWFGYLWADLAGNVLLTMQGWFNIVGFGEPFSGDMPASTVLEPGQNCFHWQDAPHMCPSPCSSWLQDSDSLHRTLALASLPSSDLAPRVHCDWPDVLNSLHHLNYKLRSQRMISWTLQVRLRLRSTRLQVDIINALPETQPSSNEPAVIEVDTPASPTSPSPRGEPTPVDADAFLDSLEDGRSPGDLGLLTASRYHRRWASVGHTLASPKASDNLLMLRTARYIQQVV